MPDFMQISNRENLLPDFSVRKIIFSENEATLLCSLFRPATTDGEGWFDSSEFQKYINYYFLLIPGANSLNLGTFIDPAVRVGACAQMAETRAEDWEMILSQPNGPRDAAPTILGHVKISLQEILQGQFFAADPILGTESNSINPESSTGGSFGHNIHFRVVIPLFNHAFSEGSVNLISFSHIDVAEMNTDFNLSGYVSRILHIGGKVKYDSCLIRNAEGNFVVPETRLVFFTQDGRTYSGPWHEYTQDSPRPGDGYIGFQAISTPQPPDDEIDRLNLQVREIANTKVVARWHLEQELGFDGRPVHDENRYKGYDITGVFGSPLESFGIPSDVSFGDELKQLLKSQLGQISQLNESGSKLYNERMKINSIMSLKAKNINLLDFSTRPEDIVWLNIRPGAEAPYYGSLFTLEMDDILIFNSRFGHILNFAKKTEKGMAMAVRMVNLSRISHINITRRRVTNRPITNNSISTGKLAVYDLNIPDKNIIETTSDEEGTILNADNLYASLDLLQEDEKFKKKMVLKDFDLFKSTQHGKYEYVIDLTLEDGIRKYLIELYESLKLALDRYAEYVREANIPFLDYRQSKYYNGSQFSDGLRRMQPNADSPGNAGNYNFSISDFTQNFKNNFAQQGEIVSAIVRSYCDCLYVLAAETGFGPNGQPGEDFVEELKSKLEARNTTLQTLGYFLDICQRLETRMRKIIFLSDNRIEETINLGTHPRSVSQTPNYPTQFIKIRSRANSIVEVISKNDVIIEPAFDADAPAMEINLAVDNFGQPWSGLRPLFVGNVFTMSSELSFDVSSGAPHVNIFPNQIANISAGYSLSSLEKTNLLATIYSAAEKARTGPAVGLGNTIEKSIADNELLMFNNLLMKYKGTTFNSMVSNMQISSAWQYNNPDLKIEDYLTKDVQLAIFKSIVSYDREADFTAQVEEQYKDFYFTKKSLGNLFNTVKSLMTISGKFYSSMQDLTYKKKVLLNTSSPEEVDKNYTKFKKETEDLFGVSFRPYTILTGHGLVPASKKQRASVIIYKLDKELPGNIKIANNVKIALSTGAGNSRLDRRATPALPPGSGGY